MRRVREVRLRLEIKWGLDEASVKARKFDSRTCGQVGSRQSDRRHRSKPSGQKELPRERPSSFREAIELSARKTLFEPRER